MIGLKTMLNEFVAFDELGKLIGTRQYNEEVLAALNGTAGNWTLNDIKLRGAS